MAGRRSPRILNVRESMDAFSPVLTRQDRESLSFVFGPGVRPEQTEEITISVCSNSLNVCSSGMNVVFGESVKSGFVSDSGDLLRQTLALESSGNPIVSGNSSVVFIG